MRDWTRGFWAGAIIGIAGTVISIAGVHEFQLHSVAAIAPIAAPAKHSNIYHSEAIANLPQSAQTCLHFVVNGQPDGENYSIAALVENSISGLNSWVGSNDFPGTIHVVPAPHGASKITWIVPAGKKTETFAFDISANGNYLTAEDGGADSIMP